MDAPKAKKYSFIDEVGYVPNEIIKKWAGVIGKIPKGPLPKIISSQEEFVKEFGTPSPANSFEKNFTLPANSFEKFTFPLLKKVNFSTIADNLVSIQPLPPPSMKGLKATLSVEAAEDLGVEEELIQAMSQQMAKEVDEQILKDLIEQVQIEQVQEAKRRAAIKAIKAEEKRREAIWRSTFSVIGRRYLDPEEIRAEEESEIETVERKVIVVVPDLPFGLGCRRVLV